MKFNLLLHSGIASLSLFACGVNAATDLGPAGDIHFSITITTKACEMEKSDLEVDMGTMCGVVINSGLSPSSLDEPASLEWCGM